MSKERWVYGFHAVLALLRHNAKSVLRVYYDDSRTDPRMRRFLEQSQQWNIPFIKADTQRLTAMTGTTRHQGVAAQAVEIAKQEFVPWLKAAVNESPDLILMILDGITDPHNLGACFRVADATGVSGIIAPKDRSVGINSTVEKVASGAVETVPFFTVTNLARTIEQIKDAGIWVYGTEAEAETLLPNADLTGPVAWVFGAEGDGMRRLTRENCDVLVSIPMYGHVESLNISVSSGICLYETRRQRLSKESGNI